MEHFEVLDESQPEDSNTNQRNMSVSYCDFREYSLPRIAEPDECDYNPGS